MILARIVIILLLYADDMVLLARFPSDLDKKIKLLKDLFSSMGMIIKSKKDTYVNFMYDNSNLEEVSSYNYLGIDIHNKLNWNHRIEKRINGGLKAYLVLKIIVKQQAL